MAIEKLENLFKEKMGVDSLKMDITQELCKNILRRIILAAFGYEKMEQIDLVYPKVSPKTKKDVENLCEVWLESNVRNLQSNDETSNTNQIDQSEI
jgi:hypothetical protein